jgi:hypothetical protein
MSRRRPEYSDDIFADTRMSFGDHPEELRHRMWNAVKALLFCLVIGFFLDGVGSTFDWKNFGIGKPALEIIGRLRKRKSPRRKLPRKRRSAKKNGNSSWKPHRACAKMIVRN